MALSPGDKLGPYEVIAAIGKGGMGEVYKARDPRIDRIVALKTSHAQFSERFEREAKAIGALNHPNICTLFDVGPNYLVMEYVEGVPLKGPIPVDQSLRQAVQICAALDAAHKKGITHRDLKPGNILATKSGVKLLDFGLAKLSAAGHAPGPEDATLTMALTGKNEIVGTLFYMSPEQLQAQGDGREIDGRSDIFSFGVVLYELLTGKRAFDGSSPASVIAAIMERPAPSIADVAPPALDRLLRKCLEKDPDDRWQSARDLKDELEWILRAPAAVDAAQRPRSGWIWPAAAIAALVALCVLAAVHFLQAPPPEPPTTRFQIAPPENSNFDYFRLSPDGRLLAFAAAGKLWLRPLDALQAFPLAGTEGAEELFWSPDSQFIAFFAQGKLNRIAASGGPVQVICSVSTPYGGAWNRDGVIVLPLSFGSGLFRVSASGGTPAPLSAPAGTSRALAPQAVPEFLPDGRHFVYWDGGERGSSGGKGVYVGSTDGQPIVHLIPGVTNIVYARLPGTMGKDGYLFFRRGRTLMAQSFDPTGLRLAGEAIPVVEKLSGSAKVLWAPFSIAGNGTLVYSAAQGSDAVQLTWWDRAGKRLASFGPSGAQSNFRLAPDGKRVVYSTSEDGNPDVWVRDSERGVASRLTFDAGIDDPPVWSPDGAQVAWASNRSGAFDIYTKSSNGAGQEQLVIKMGTVTGWPEDWSRDGRHLLYEIPGAKTGEDLWIAPLPSKAGDGGGKPFPYLQSEFDERHGRFSPDGRWVTYTSNESGRDEVYVQSFPLSGAKFQISSGGGIEPSWRNDGAELFYIAGDRTLMAVPVQQPRSTSEALQVGPPKRLFLVPIVDRFIVGRSYEVSRDGQRFLMHAPHGGSSAPPLTVVLNWRPR